MKRQTIKNFARMLTVFSVLAFSAAIASAQTVKCGGIGGTIRTQEIQIPQQGGGNLNAKIYAPDKAKQTAACPGISLLPGGGAPLTSVEWAATRLAANGYVVIITKPERGGSVESYSTAAKSAIDFLLSKANPFLKDTNTKLFGAAGWSLGARALVKTQEEDTRIGAIVGWDNISSSETGDVGSPACRNAPGTLRTPRVPALGQASETCKDGRDAEAKKNGFSRWRDAKKPAMQVVFKGATHFFWSVRAGNQRSWNLAAYYTQNWFDRWLKNDKTATQRLLSRKVGYESLESILSPTFHSAAFFDGYDCTDFLAECKETQNKKSKAGVSKQK